MSSRWAPEAERLYDHVRLLGSGAFSSIWVAKPKQRIPCPHHYSQQVDCTCDYVAMKSTVIAQRGDPEYALEYAEREVQILRELDHPHIMKVLHEFPFHESPVFSVALTLASGPTLEQLVERGGALGIPFVQHVTKQLISAISYMHSHAVIHRDIKPDNVIIMGANLCDDANWCDQYDDRHLQESLPKWNAILIDFGFAVALKPDDIKKSVSNSDPSKTSEMSKLRSRYSRQMSLDQKLSPGATALDNDVSVSKIQVVDLASVGNRNYAAPEILKTLHKQKGNPSGHNVSNYGMTADAYSMGALLRYMLTGVPPEYTIEEYIARKNNFVTTAANFLSSLTLFSCRSKAKSAKESDGLDKKTHRRKRFKRNDSVPKEAANLVHLMTMRDTQHRLTIRSAQAHPWIKLKEESDPSVHAPLQFLDSCEKQILSK